LPIKQDFLPSCYKTYEVKHSVRDEYTAQADEMMALHNDHGGIILVGTLESVIPNDLFEEPSDSYFTSTLSKSKDINQASTEIDGKSPYTSLSSVNCPLRTKSTVGTLSQVAWAKLQPTFTSITDQVVSQKGLEIARLGLENTLAELLGLNDSGGVHHDSEGKDAHHTSPNSKNLHSLPSIDVRAQNTRLVPRGSPSRHYSKGNRQHK